MAMAKLVLVVDDNHLIRTLLAKVLEPVCQVATASSGAEALAFLDSVTPDLIILDLMMPGMSGEEFLQALGEKSCSHRVIILSAHAERMRELIKHEAVVDIINKKTPEMGAIVESVRKALEN